ncbi:MAG: hypothetical protein ACRDH1_04020 [Actinomycetota bacterium]
MEVLFGRGLVAVLPLALAIDPFLLVVENLPGTEASDLFAELSRLLRAGIICLALAVSEHHAGADEHHPGACEGWKQSQKCPHASILSVGGLNQLEA